MLIYPDSSDLINLCGGKSSIGLLELARKFEVQSHRVVLSLDTLIEVAAPLRNGKMLEVRRDLNHLEQLPHVFVMKVESPIWKSTKRYAHSNKIESTIPQQSILSPDVLPMRSTFSEVPSLS